MRDLANKDVFARNLRNIMELHKKDRNQVCADLNLKYTTFADWYNGKKYPRIDKIELLANYFGVKKSVLIEDAKQEQFSSPDTPMANTQAPPSDALAYEPTGFAPILGSIPAGLAALAYEDIEGYSAVDIPDPRECFWLRVRGNSMINAGIHPGDLVLIRMQPCAENGQIVACRVNGEEATLKRFKLQGSTVILLPENPNYDPIVVPWADFETGDAGIIGVAIQIKRDL